jgi:hypothetical protein
MVHASAYASACVNAHSCVFMATSDSMAVCTYMQQQMKEIGTDSLA